MHAILLRSDTLELKMRQVFGQKLGSDPSEHPDNFSCDEVWISDIGVMDLAGEAHVGAALGSINGIPGGLQCEVGTGSSGTIFFAFKYLDKWSPLGPQRPLTSLPVGQSISKDATIDSVEPAPCREEWLVRYRSPDGKQVLSRLSLKGDVEQVLHRYDAGKNESEFFLGEVDCAAPRTSLLLRHGLTQTSSQLHHFEFDHSDGNLRDLERENSAEGVVMRAVQKGGRWFTAGITMEDVAAPRLHELVSGQADGKRIALGGTWPALRYAATNLNNQQVALAAMERAPSFVVAQGEAENDRPQAYVLGCP